MVECAIVWGALFCILPWLSSFPYFDFILCLSLAVTSAWLSVTVFRKYPVIEIRDTSVWLHFHHKPSMEVRFVHFGNLCLVLQWNVLPVLWNGFDQQRRLTLMPDMLPKREYRYLQSLAAYQSLVKNDQDTASI